MIPAEDKMRAARARFPLLDTCVYLNSNSTGALPHGAKAVLDAYWDTVASWRDEVWERWWAEYHAYADALAALIGGQPGSVVTDGNLSALLGRVMSALDFRARPRIVTSELEFPTVAFLARAFARHGAETVIVPSRDGASIDEEGLVR